MISVEESSNPEPFIPMVKGYRKGVLYTCPTLKLHKCHSHCYSRFVLLSFYVIFTTTVYHTFIVYTVEFEV